MATERKYRFERFRTDLDQQLQKNEKFKLLFEIESAKLKFAEKLSATRESMGLTQAELARKMNISQQLVSRIERGGDNITIETLVRFANILGITLIIEVARRKKKQEVIRFV
jgi:ribosome-binding protein aMBF1 (putative translation factor)